MTNVPLLSASLAAILLSACAPAQVKLPAGLEPSAIAHAVSGHSPRRFNQPIHFGPYSARRMHEGDTFQWEALMGRTALRGTERPEVIEVVLTEGRHRQVRRMIGACGPSVTSLHRTAVGPYELGDLAEGEWRAEDPSLVRG